MFGILKWTGFLLLLIAGALSIYAIGYCNHPNFKSKVILPTVTGMFVTGLILCFCAIVVK